MHKYIDRTLISMAIAIFSMFFGAGNAVFPLLLGVQTGLQFHWAFFGLAITAIGGPLLGLVGATLYRGRCLDFFARAGKIPGTLLLVVTLALLGPFAVLPRCITVAFAALHPLVPTLPMWLFAILFGAVTVGCCWYRHILLPALGYILSPMLIGCLALIIYQGLVAPQPLDNHSITAINAFLLGLATGYDTMDLIASIYFSAGIWTMLTIQSQGNDAMILKKTLGAGSLGCLLLGVIYFGLTHAAARFGPLLIGVAPEEVMIRLAAITLGPTLGIAANLAIALACLTTVISLTMTISDIASQEIWPNYVSYRMTLFLISLVTTVMANMGFGAIMQLIHPLVSVCYPLIIVLTIVNIAFKCKPTRCRPYP